MTDILHYSVDYQCQFIIDTDRLTHRIFISKILIGKRFGDHGIVSGSQSLLFTSLYQREAEEVKKSRVGKHQVCRHIILSVPEGDIIEDTGHGMAYFFDLRITLFQTVSNLVSRSDILTITYGIDTVSIFIVAVGRQLADHIGCNQDHKHQRDGQTEQVDRRIALVSSQEIKKGLKIQYIVHCSVTLNVSTKSLAIIIM